ncbi:formylglycine-generating enzyme family protein, partial [Candidatus Hydrogenedentota bacterium]
APEPEPKPEPQPGPPFTVDGGNVITDSLGMTFRLIEPGSFMMGSMKGKQEEQPVHEVTLSESFRIGVNKVTQAQYESVMGTNPSRTKDSALPVGNIFWHDAEEFCRQMTRREGVLYRLPTEAEWEYACRAGTVSEYYWGDERNDKFAKLPNPWGLAGMSGMACEWCADWFDPHYYSKSPSLDPSGSSIEPNTASRRAIRGRSSVYRGGSVPWYPLGAGLRVVRDENSKAPSFAQSAAVAKPAVGEPEEVTNSIGMKLKLIQPGSFMMGSDHGLETQKPVHKVTITRPFYIGIYEVTQAQYEEIARYNPSKFKGPIRPVEQLTWDDAKRFCKRLSEKEKMEYRLPTEAEWEYACRAGTTTECYWGNGFDERFAWCSENSGHETREVGMSRPNPWGLHDMLGNVNEWCEDWYRGGFARMEEVDPEGPSGGKGHVLRGGCWTTPPDHVRCATRTASAAIRKRMYGDFGFRIVRSLSTRAAEPEKVHEPSAKQPAERVPEKTAISTQEPAPPISVDEGTMITNSLGMKLRYIEAGVFIMGSENGFADERPAHKVTITKPYYIGVYEVTQDQYKSLTRSIPSKFRGSDLPVESVTYHEAFRFCTKLSEKEGEKYRLPTEAEWEYACRAGTSTEYFWGGKFDPRYAWYGENSGEGTRQVGSRLPNPWGLHDMIGNVWEWCQDRYDGVYYANSPGNDPWNEKSSSAYVLRGGSWRENEYDNFLRSSRRCRSGSKSRSDFYGFRVVMEQKQASEE